MVDELEVRFWTDRGIVHAVNGVSFDIAPGETLGIVGESGCGKSVTSLAVLGILPRAGRVTSGSARFDGTELTTMSDSELRGIRGSQIAMIFQDPMTSLNPVLSIGRQIREPLETHLGLNKKAALDRATELLDQVGIPSPRSRLSDYPHQFSGGMRQRAMIAMALACEPKLLIADEPTTALDVTIQAQILDLLRALVAERDTALIMITHDLGVVAGICERVTGDVRRHVRGERDRRSDLRRAATSIHARTPRRAFRASTHGERAAEPHSRSHHATCSKRRRGAHLRLAVGSAAEPLRQRAAAPPGARARACRCRCFFPVRPEDAWSHRGVVGST